jgi:hypothetical protein
MHTPIYAHTMKKMVCNAIQCMCACVCVCVCVCVFWATVAISFMMQVKTQHFWVEKAYWNNYTNEDKIVIKMHWLYVQALCLYISYMQYDCSGFN